MFGAGANNWADNGRCARTHRTRAEYYGRRVQRVIQGGVKRSACELSAVHLWLISRHWSQRYTKYSMWPSCSMEPNAKVELIFMVICIFPQPSLFYIKIEHLVKDWVCKVFKAFAALAKCSVITTSVQTILFYLYWPITMTEIFQFWNLELNLKNLQSVIDLTQH